MFRLILFALGAIIVAIETAFTYPVYWIVKKFNRRKADFIAFHFVQRGFKMWIFLCGIHITYKGLEYLPEDGDPVFFASNHRSLFDPILTYPVLKGLTGNLAKIELKSYPIIGWWIKSIYGVLLDRKDRRQGMQCILECIDNINHGISMLAYPEGTRSHVEGQLLRFHKGTFKIATKPGVRIIPVAISGSGDIFDDHRPYFKSRKVIVEFCEPIETKDLINEDPAAVQIQDIVHDIIQAKLDVNTPEVM